MKVWVIQPGIAPYRIPLFERLARAPGVDLSVVLVAEQVPGQPWQINHLELPFNVLLVAGINRYVDKDRERQIQLPLPLLWRLPLHRPDVVICTGFALSTLVVWLYNKIFGIRYIIWNEGTEYSDAGISNIKYRLRRLMAQSASAFIVAGSLSKKYAQTLLDNPERASFFISFNCVDNRNFIQSADSLCDSEEYRRLRARLPARNILHVGKLNERKGVIELMDAYRDLVVMHDMHDLALVLLGQGPLEQYVRTYAAQHHLKHVYLEGFVAQEAINVYYAAADAFVLLSRFDCNPLVIFEALASGKPIVCSNRAGNAPDFIRDGENGYIVDPFDHEQVVERLHRALEDIDRDHARETSRALVAMANYDDATRAFVDAVHHAVA
jgi:glycosyltransferase involved in cell wall biosynthesis